MSETKKSRTSSACFAWSSPRTRELCGAIGAARPGEWRGSVSAYCQVSTMRRQARLLAIAEYLRGRRSGVKRMSSPSASASPCGPSIATSTSSNPRISCARRAGSRGWLRARSAQFAAANQLERAGSGPARGARNARHPHALATVHRNPSQRPRQNPRSAFLGWRNANCSLRWNSSSSSAFLRWPPDGVVPTIEDAWFAQAPVTVSFRRKDGTLSVRTVKLSRDHGAHDGLDSMWWIEVR